MITDASYEGFWMNNAWLIKLVDDKFGSLGYDNKCWW